MSPERLKGAASTNFSEFLARMSLRSSICHMLVLWLTSSVGAEPISVFDGIGDGSLVFGGEDLIKDFASLATKPTSDLPEVFTICSSLSTLSMKGSTPDRFFWQLLTKNGSGGIYASIAHSLESQRVHTMRMSVDGVLLNFSNHTLFKLPTQVYLHSCSNPLISSGHLRCTGTTAARASTWSLAWSRW